LPAYWPNSGGTRPLLAMPACTVARPTWRRLLMHLARLAASRARWMAGRSRPMRLTMMAMTTSISIRVNAFRFVTFSRDIGHPFFSGNHAEQVHCGPCSAGCLGTGQGLQVQHPGHASCVVGSSAQGFDGLLVRCGTKHHGRSMLSTSSDCTG